MYGIRLSQLLVKPVADSPSGGCPAGRATLAQGVVSTPFFAGWLRRRLLHLHAGYMAYAILRTTKLKSAGEIAGSLAHTYRTRATPNADPARLDLNEHHDPATAPDKIREAIYSRLPKKRRSDSVLCLEYFIGASPEYFSDNQDGADYFAAALEWLRERHGAENLVAWSIHRDETSPHLVAYVVPMLDGKLNAKHFLGGKAKLSAMQTDFAARAGAPHGLERGIEGSKAKHTTIRQYYAALERGEVTHGHLKAKTLAPRKDETPEQVAERITGAIHRHYDPALRQAAAAALAKKRAHEMAATAKAKDAEVRTLRQRLSEALENLRTLRATFVDGLTGGQQFELADLAAMFRESNPAHPVTPVASVRQPRKAMPTGESFEP